MRKLIIYTNGEQAVIENGVLELGLEQAEEIDLTPYSDEDFETLLNDRRFTPVRDKNGTVTGLKKGTRILKPQPKPER